MSSSLVSQPGRGLSDDRQDAIATRLLAELENEEA